MRTPITILEGKRLPRVIFSLRVPGRHQEMSDLMKRLYDAGVWCFDLSSPKVVEAFRQLKRLTDDEGLIGIGHLDVENGVSFSGSPLHRFEARIVSTLKRTIVPAPLIHTLFPNPTPSELFTQKEIDRISLDAPRFEDALSRFDPQEIPFLFLGERYSDWLLALGRIDLLKEMVAKVRAKRLIPIFSGQWATFLLPKARPLDVAAFAVPINKTGSHFDLDQACRLIKKFEKPVISLNPLADGKLLKESKEAFHFLFDEVKIYSAVVEVALEDEVETILTSLKTIPSLIPPRKT